MDRLTRGPRSWVQIFRHNLLAVIRCRLPLGLNRQLLATHVARDSPKYQIDDSDTALPNPLGKVR